MQAALIELLMAKLRRNRLNLVVDLEGLTRDEAALNVQRVLGHAADDRVVEHLYKQSHGVPIYLNTAYVSPSCFYYGCVAKLIIKGEIQN